ncbi:MAG: hypothetical protein MZU95_09155 [Desulfomicrobium escambiense]|nr:hypothetical protein [Desulfomicrobium escambiense]
MRRARQEGVKAGMLRLKTIWPFPERGRARDMLEVGQAVHRPGDEPGPARPRGRAGRRLPGPTWCASARSTASSSARTRSIGNIMRGVQE